MRIKNVGKCTIIFKGGVLNPGKVAVFNGSAEKIGESLLRAYPNNLEDLDCVKKEDIIDVVVEETEPKKVVVKKPVAKKSKK